MPDRRFDGDDPHRGLLLLEPSADPHDRSRRPEPGDESVDGPAGLLPDLAAGIAVVRPHVCRVLELVRQKIGFRIGLVNPLGHPDRPVGPETALGEHELGAEGLERAAALEAHALRHRELDGETERRTDHREPDAGVAGGRLEDRLPRPQRPALETVAYHFQRDAVFDRAAGVGAFELREQAHPWVGIDPLEFHQRRVADHVQYAHHASDEKGDRFIFLN